jgi:hypothetical protein
MPFLPVLIALHVALAVTLFLPSILLPLALRAGRSGVSAASPRRVTGALLALQETGTFVVAAGLAITGLALVAVLGLRIVEQPWLLVALLVYTANLVLALVVQRPNVRRLLGTIGAGDEQAWRERAVRQRYVSYGMAGLVGVIGWLMSTKPALW